MRLGGRGALAVAAYAAVTVACAALLPLVAEILGYHLVGSVWSRLRLTSPLFQPAGKVVAGALGGLVVGLLQRPFLRRRHVILPQVAAGTAVGLGAAAYAPLVVLVAPVAAGTAAAVQVRQARFIRAHSIAAAWAALALLLPFPQLAREALLVAAGLIAAWGYAAVVSMPRNP